MSLGVLNGIAYKNLSGESIMELNCSKFSNKGYYGSGGRTNLRPYGLGCRRANRSGTKLNER